MADEEEIIEETLVGETPPEEKEEETTPPEKPAEPMVPLHRFREVNEKLSEVEKEITDLKQQKATSGGLSEEQQKELQAKTYLKTLLKETLEEDKKSAEAQETAEQRQFEKSVDEVLEINSGVQKKDFVEFMEKNAEKYGIESVSGAMKLYLDLNKLSAEEREKGKKDILGKPNLPHSEGAGGATQVPPEDKGRTLNQVLQDVISKIGK